MPEQSMNSLFEKLGNIDGSVREMKHAANNLSQKVDAVNVKVDNLALAIVKQDQHSHDIADHDQRLRVLEIDKNRREGAIGLVEWCAKHWPFLGLSGFLAAWVAYANGLLK